MVLTILQHYFALVCSLYAHTLPFKSLGSLGNVLVFEEHIFCPLKYKIDQKYSVDIVNVVNDHCSWKRLIYFDGISTQAYRVPLASTITSVFQWQVVLANPSLSF